MYLKEEIYGVPNQTSISTFKRFTMNILKIFEEVQFSYEKEREKKLKHYVLLHIFVPFVNSPLFCCRVHFYCDYSGLHVHDLTLNNPKDY